MFFFLLVMAGAAEPEVAMRRIRISNYLNIIGVVVGIIIIAIRITLSYTCE